MKICSDCKESKDVSEFYYQKHRDSYTKRCKVCRRKWMRSKEYYNNSEPPEHEQLVVSKLIENGIFACHGRDMAQFAHVDIVAWGTVRIEAKLFKPHNSKPDSPNAGYYAGISKAQRDRGMLAEVVCIVFENELYFLNQSIHRSISTANFGERYFTIPIAKDRTQRKTES